MHGFVERQAAPYTLHSWEQRVLNPCGGETHCLGEEAAPVLSPKPPTCSHSAVVASAAKGQLSLGSLNPKRRSVERVGAAQTARAGKEAGRPFRPPLS